MSGMPVVPQAKPLASVVPLEGGTPRPFVTVNGAASAGSKHLLGSADALVEQTRLQIASAADARTLTVHAEQGQGSHAWVALVTVDPGDDIVAADRLNSGTPDVKTVLPGATRDIFLSAGALNVYVIAMPAVGATAASCTGRIWLEVNGNA